MRNQRLLQGEDELRHAAGALPASRCQWDHVLGWRYVAACWFHRNRNIASASAPLNECRAPSEIRSLKKSLADNAALPSVNEAQEPPSNRLPARQSGFVVSGCALPFGAFEFKCWSGQAYSAPPSRFRVFSETLLFAKCDGWTGKANRLECPVRAADLRGRTQRFDDLVLFAT